MTFSLTFLLLTGLGCLSLGACFGFVLGAVMAIGSDRARSAARISPARPLAAAEPAEPEMR